jgi:NADH dehydrogenase [ubiquinone] 1 alpha subcomplex assembly factor 7
MKECLLHPTTGYYMKKDVFGAKGDFTTSPEISQVFGELLAVWVLADWMAGGEPHPCQLIELGPGRGTLLKDMVRVFGQFSRILESLSVHLVEASPALSRVQEATLTGVNKEQTSSDKKAIFVESPYKTCTLDSGVSVSWYQRLEDVPTGHSYIIAHEFFDALPIHQFQVLHITATTLYIFNSLCTYSLGRVIEMCTKPLLPYFIRKLSPVGEKY